MATSLDTASALEQTVARYNDAWNAHDLDTIMSLHAPDMVFHNHTAGESAVGEEVRSHIGAIFESWTATATHAKEARRGDLVIPPTGRTISWDGMDVIPFESGLVKRKDVYSDSVSVLRQLGLFE